tara:strand:- start:202 stop:351 length:150 start_codon:yes stop_codon:yes gene_type:complete
MAIRSRRLKRVGLVKSEGSKLRSENKKLLERIEALEKQLSTHIVSISTD